MRYLAALTSLFLFLLPNQLAAEVYRYVDHQGVTHYTTDPSSIPDQYRKGSEEPHTLPRINKADLNLPEPVYSARRSQKKVVLLVTKTCPYCTMAEEFLKSHDVDFRKYDVQRSSTGKRLHREAGGGGVPVVFVGDTTVRGFSPNRMKSLLNLP